MAEIRLAYLVTHPIQYQAPLLRRLAREPGLDLTVFFCSDFSAKRFLDPTFGRVIDWDVPCWKVIATKCCRRWAAGTGCHSFGPLITAWARGCREGRFQVLWIHGYNRWFHWLAMWSGQGPGPQGLDPG